MDYKSDYELKYFTEGSVGIDMYCAENSIIEPQSWVKISLNTSIKLPKNYMGLITARSSAYKKGIIINNGIIDIDFCGNDDIIHVVCFNTTKKPVIIKKDDRICQLILIKIKKPKLNKVFSLKSKNRGGFGSTDKK